MQLPAGYGFDNNFGAPRITSQQVGFWGAVTVAYSASTDSMGRVVGYTCKRLVVDPATGAVTDPASQQWVVTNVYDGRGDTTLAVGTVVWLEPDPGANGWTIAGVGAADPTAGLSTCAAIAGLTEDDCLTMTVATVSGACSGIDTAQEFQLAWDAGDARWESAPDAFTGTGSGGTGQVVFGKTDGVPYALIDGVYGTPLGCDDDGGWLFAFGGPVLCGGTSVPCADYFVVRFVCDCCTIEGYLGPGWYCVESAPDTCDLVVELIDDDRCDDEIVICSGPYDTEADAVLACGADLPDPGADCPGAGPVAPGTSVTHTVAAAEEHWYVLSAVINTEYTIAISGAGVGTVSTAFKSPTCVDSFGMGFSDNGSFNFTIGGTQSVWIVVTGVAGGPYTLTITSP